MGAMVEVVGDVQLGLRSGVLGLVLRWEKKLEMSAVGRMERRWVWGKLVLAPT